jgi:hypothetical protein
MRFAIFSVQLAQNWATVYHQTQRSNLAMKVRYLIALALSNGDRSQKSRAGPYPGSANPPNGTFASFS